MADKMEKIASIPSVQFSFKFNGYKLRSVGYEVSFCCHDDIFILDPTRSQLEGFMAGFIYF